MKATLGILLSTLTLVGWLPARAPAAIPYPDASTPKAIDLGAFDAASGSTPLSVTIALRLPHLDQAEALLKSINTPGDPQFHKFLSAEEFVARFAPADADVAKVVAALGKYGLAVSRTGATTLKVTGSSAEMERAFAVSLHAFEIPAHGNSPKYVFHGPLSHPKIPAEIFASVAAVAGLDTRPSLRPMLRSAPRPVATPRATAPHKTTGNAFGYLTVTDFANHYDVQPLYSRGVTGHGRTLGIMTLASFTPSDAFAYWNALKLSVNSNRINIVNVDGGPGAPSDDSGSLETTIDVEQSGGIAPGANIIVYQAPNTNQGFIDVFASAVDADTAESLSISWGFWEWFYNFENAPVTDPSTGKTVSSLQAVHEMLVRAAIQGQSVFAAAGDGGAYDVNNDLGCYGPYSSSVPTSCALTLTVDYPASDPAITAAGGTTLPGVQEYCLDTACSPPYVIDIEHERVWGWDYLDGFCNALGLTPITCGTFPGGGGGGVSVIFDQPYYQNWRAGTQSSQPGQIYEASPYYIGADGIVGLYYALPAYFPGRNVPDLSFNADPETGYIVYYTSSVSGYGEEPFWGGTSFVGPQLNGVSALLGDYLHLQKQGLGLLNGIVYGLAQSGHAYGYPGAPLHEIAYGDNWFYHGRNGYSPAAGLGTPDVFHLAEYLREFH